MTTPIRFVCAAAAFRPARPRFLRATRALATLAGLAGLAFSSLPAANAAPLVFGHQTDIGSPSRAGTMNYDAASNTYNIGGGGANMWFKSDSFHFVWKQMSGDFALQAEVAFVGTSSQPHRKACLIIRQSLAPDSAYADAALHGDGLTSLQFRSTGGEVTHEVQSAISAPESLRIEKIGGMVYLSLAGADGVFHPSGCSVAMHFTEPFYVGLGVCAHDPEAFETAVFSKVELGGPSASVTAVRSSLETVTIASGDRRSVYHSDEVIEAPNWSRDGAALLFNGGGRLYRLLLAAGAAPTLIDTGFAVKCNNDHGLSPDGSLLAISDQTREGGSRIYVLPAAGGPPRLLTELAPSYWHGWSPDGRTLAYCAQRNGKFGLCTVPAAGGEEKRLTNTDGLDDGPDYSPDGRWIYFNSDRSGLMQIWRLHPDGSAMEQVTHDGLNNWFAHPSPDGKWLVFLTFAADVKGHPPDKDVMLRLVPVDGDRVLTDKITVLAQLFGGQGTNNVPSWSPDSTKMAYVRYQPAK